MNREIIDNNSEETAEWVESFEYVYKKFGINRANFILNVLKKHMNEFDNVDYDYINTINDKYNNKDCVFKFY